MRGVVAEAETPLERFTSLPGGDVFFVSSERGTKEPLLTYVRRAVRHRLRCGCRHGGVPRGESGAGEHDAFARQSRIGIKRHDIANTQRYRWRLPRYADKGGIGGAP